MNRQPDCAGRRGVCRARASCGDGHVQRGQERGRQLAGHESQPSSGCATCATTSGGPPALSGMIALQPHGQPKPRCGAAFATTNSRRTGWVCSGPGRALRAALRRAGPAGSASQRQRLPTWALTVRSRCTGGVTAGVQVGAIGPGQSVYVLCNNMARVLKLGRCWDRSPPGTRRTRPGASAQWPVRLAAGAHLHGRAAAVRRRADAWWHGAWHAAMHAPGGRNAYAAD